MSPTTRSLALTAVPAALLVTLLPPLTAGAAVPGPAPRPSLTWGPCAGASGADPRQECATLRVPMDHADPDGPQISLAVSRFPAENPSSRRGASMPRTQRRSFGHHPRGHAPRWCETFAAALRRPEVRAGVCVES